MPLHSAVKGSFFALLPLLFTSIALADKEEDKPLWEIGMVAIALSIPQYMGGEERYNLPLAAPFFVYRGEFFKADRDGIRGVFYKKENLSLDLGFGFDLPVSNDDGAREDMPRLYLTGQVGPRINWTFDMPVDTPEVSLHLPLRYTLDTHKNALGWVAEPTLKIIEEGLGSEKRMQLRIDLGVLFTSEEYNDYYYSVGPQYVTAERPAYDAGSGLHSYFAKMNAEYQLQDNLKLRAYLIARFLSPGVIDDSPLVKDELYLGGGIGFIWSLWQSKERVRNH
ncbi:MAG: MipA/OmpV family protein [Candidatus Thiodiazotropha sp. (ex Lucinoma kastoroae)]|nr:MipA/OmpV family protein [Candidatus Thiodiazotropha sp. (ex Lucinoma kastoroae)]MCU7862122.1 MipA/OmpV family protein [Candidatus Thiodiazotropha sp. (ex Lucinoma kastoroae)]